MIIDRSIVAGWRVPVPPVRGVPFVVLVAALALCVGACVSRPLPSALIVSR